MSNNIREQSFYYIIEKIVFINYEIYIYFFNVHDFILQNFNLTLKSKFFDDWRKYQWLDISMIGDGTEKRSDFLDLIMLNVHISCS